MDRATVEAAVEQLRGEGKRPSVRSVLALIGGKTETFRALLRDILGTLAPADAELHDWRESSAVQALRTHDAQLRDRLATIEAEMVKHRNALDSGPGVLRALWRRIHLKQAQESEVTRVKAGLVADEESLSRLQAEADILREELDALAEAIAEASRVAQELAAAMREDERADLHALLEGMEREMEIHARLYHRYLLAGKQFQHGDQVTVRAGLGMLWNSDACRLQRGISTGDRFTLGGPFLHRYNQLRKACGLPEDRGIHTKKSQAAYETIMAEKAAHDALPAVMEHRRRAEAYQKEREAERAADQRAHVAATQQAMKDAQRR